MSRAPLLGKAGSKVGRKLAELQPLGGQPWPPAHARAGEEARLASGPEGRAISAPRVSEVGSLLGPLSGHNVLACFTVGWLTDREQWLAEGRYGQLADWVGGSQPEQRAYSYNLSCHLGQGEGQFFKGWSLTPCGELSNPSLPHTSTSPMSLAAVT